MLSEGLEKDFTNWELRVAQECEIVKALLGEEVNEENEEIFHKLDELAKLFGTDAPKFVELLKVINKRVFIDKITKRESVEIDDYDRVVALLKEKGRIPTRYIKNLHSLMNFDARNFKDIKLPTLNEVLLVKSIPRGDERKAKKAKLDVLHEKFERLIYTMISFSNIVAWYYRTYEEKPDIGFTWDFDGDGGERKRKESGKIPVVQEFMGILDSQYDIMRAPIRWYNRQIIVDNCMKFEKVIEHVYQVPREIKAEKTFYEGQPFVKPYEIVTEKYLEKPAEVREEATEQKEIAVQVTKAVKIEKVVERQVTKNVVKKVEVEKEVIKKQSPVLMIILIIVFFLVGFGVGYFLNSGSETAQAETEEVTTEDDENTADVETDANDVTDSEDSENQAD